MTGFYWLGWLVAALRPVGPFPLLSLQGEQGTGKSTVAKLVRQLIDPSTVPLRTIPKDERDLMVSANGSWVITADNLSNIPKWASDAFCRLSTGGGFSTRQLHTDTDEILIEFQRPTIITSID